MRLEQCIGVGGSVMRLEQGIGAGGSVIKLEDASFLGCSGDFEVSK